VPERPEPPPSLLELVNGLVAARDALTALLELLVTAPNALAVMIDQGSLMARAAEARRDIRDALTRLEDDL
jgi:hypothetical protein